MDGVEKESSPAAICVNRLCNSQTWVKCQLNGFSVLEETERIPVPFSLFYLSFFLFFIYPVIALVRLSLSFFSVLKAP